MKRWLFIFAVFLLFVIAQAALVPVKIPSPGATGMNSNADVQELKITDSPYMENVNTQRLPGQINKRFPLRSVSDNDVEVYAAFGYYDVSTGMRQIVAVANGRDSFVTAFNTPDTGFYLLSADTISPILRISNRFEGGVQDDTVEIAGNLGGPPYRSVLFNSALAITSKGNLPLAYIAYGTTNTSQLTNPDTNFYSPRVLSLGLEAPGQLRVGLLNDAGIVYGTYRYAYTETATATDYGLPSRWVIADSDKVVLNLFESRAASSPALTNDTGTVLIEIIRQKFNDDRWFRIDTFTMGKDQNVFYVDNNADGFSYGSPPKGAVIHINTHDPIRLVAENAVTLLMGAMRSARLFDTTRPGGVGDVEFHDSTAATYQGTYYVTYTYFDPFTGAESPFGPIVKCIEGAAPNASLTDTIRIMGRDTVCTAFVKGFTKIGERPGWIRVYRGSEADDSIKWVAVAQLRANECWGADSTRPNLQYVIFPGARHDSMLISGTGDFPYTEYLVPVEDDGSGLIRPPYIEQLQIGYTDITYANGRFWGIGDPLFPLRLYYSTYQDMFQWSAISFLSMNEDDVDELVAIEVLPSRNLDVLFAIAHNTTYMVSGYDPEFDLTWQTISSEIGAISRSTVVRKGDAIYFLAMNMRIYELTSSRGLREISQPIENYIDTLFTDAETAAKICVVYALQDKIVFSDTANNRALVYVPRSNWWGIEQYKSDFEPIGSFQYDSTRGDFSQDQSDYWIYQGGAGEKFAVEFTPPTSGSIVDTINGSNFNYSAIYRTPYVGDGQNLYMITKCDIVGRWTGGTMKIRIVNGFGAEVGMVEVTDLAPQADRMHTIGMPSHQGSYLALEFVSNTLVQRYDIHSVVVHYKRMGRVAVK